MNIRFLPWDAKFFKMKIGRILQKSHERIDLERVYEQAKKLGYTLLYIECDARLPETEQDKGHLLLADLKTTLRVNAVKATSVKPSWDIIEYKGNQSVHDLTLLAYESGIYSRYHTDPKFPDTLYKKLYKCWLCNSVNKKLADIVFICLNNDSKPIGFITLKKDKGTAHVGLIAVDKLYRRKNVAYGLLMQGLEWSKVNSCANFTITTQYDNKAAMSLYRKFGFKIVSKKYFYHYWIY